MAWRAIQWHMMIQIAATVHNAIIMQQGDCMKWPRWYITTCQNQLLKTKQKRYYIINDPNSQSKLPLIPEQCWLLLPNHHLLHHPLPTIITPLTQQQWNIWTKTSKNIHLTPSGNSLNSTSPVPWPLQSMPTLTAPKLSYIQLTITRSDQHTNQ